MEHKLNLGVSVFHDPEMPVRDFCEFLIRRKVGWIEVKLEPVLHYQGMKDEDAVALLRGVAARVPVSIHALFLELNAGSVNPEVRRLTVSELKRCVELAAGVGPGTLVTVHPGDNAEAPSELFPAVRENTVTVFREVLDLARRRGVRLGLENRGQVKGDGYKCGRTCQELMYLRGRLGDDVSYTVDVGHLTFVGADPVDYVKGLGPQNVALAHLHNNSGQDDEHAATPEGLVDYGAFLSAYHAEGWSFPLVVEVKSVPVLMRSMEHLSSLWRTVVKSGGRARVSERAGSQRLVRKEGVPRLCPE